jgi:NAD(P)H-hydrate epimerase
MTPSDIPAITTEQMIEVDRLMIAVFGIELIQMMENAGRNLAALSRDRFLDGQPHEKRVLILAGSGGNGGGGLVAARRLHNWGAQVHVFTTKPILDFRGVPAHQGVILSNMGIRVTPAAEIETLPPADLILDAVIGNSLSGAPRGQSARLLEMATVSGTPILSLDVPSGLDSTTGEVFEPYIRATATMTLALPKTGLVGPTAHQTVGELYLADISVPVELYAQMGLSIGTIFSNQDIVKLTGGQNGS